MKSFLFSIFFLTTMTASAAIRRMPMDAKFPTQQMLEKQSFGTPDAAATDNGFDDNAGATSAAAATVSTFLAQPDVPRNVVITPGGTTTDVESCVVVVNGTNIHNRVISESLTFAANASTATTGAKAFKSVTSVVFPANCESGGFAATWDMGYGEKIGLKRCLAVAGDWAWSHVAGAYETTRATMAADADEVEKNTADFNGTMNGSNAFVGYFIQNWAAACFP